MQCVPCRVEEVLCPAVCERIELLESWKAGHTGFSAHNAVTVQAGDGGGLERLAGYLLRPPLSLERLILEPGLARYRHKRAKERRGEPFDPAELLARLVMHIPVPRLHMVRYYGHSSHVSRARRRRAGCDAAAEAASGSDSPDAAPLDDEVSRAERSRLRRQWAQLIRRIYESDPRLCACGAQRPSHWPAPGLDRLVPDPHESSNGEPTAASPAPRESNTLSLVASYSSVFRNSLNAR